jgi:hypothetical protein
MARAISVPSMDLESFDAKDILEHEFSTARDILEQLQVSTRAPEPLPVAKDVGEPLVTPMPESQSRIIATSPEAVLGAYRLARGRAARVRRARILLFVVAAAISSLFLFVFIAASLADVSGWWQLVIAVTTLATLAGMSRVRVAVNQYTLMTGLSVDHYRKLLEAVGVTGERATEAMRRAETMNAR